MMRGETSAATVVIPAHSEKQWALLTSAVASVRLQVPPPAQVIVSIDHNPDLLRRVQSEMPNITAIPNRFSPGASGARNSGAERARTSIIAFLDSDVVARDNWLANLIAPLSAPSVIGTGGFVAANWTVGKPDWFPDEFGWVVGATFHASAGSASSSVRNVWAESMAVRRDAFLHVGGFRLEFCKVGDVPRPEDTDLCIRMSRSQPGTSWVFAPSAVVDHNIGPDRSRFSFFVKRCFSEGRTKVEFARLHSGASELREEYRYVQSALTFSFLRYLLDGLRERRCSRIRQAGAVAIGVTSAGIGAALSSIRPR
jgi:GT2 family glycosyltransferase